ncbi:putative nuclear maintenance protein SRP40, partial [Chlamydia psittaci 06-1683]
GYLLLNSDAFSSRSY